MCAARRGEHVAWGYLLVAGTVDGGADALLVLAAVFVVGCDDMYQPTANTKTIRNEIPMMIFRCSMMSSLSQSDVS